MASRTEPSEYAKKAGRAVRHVGAAVRAGLLVRQPCVDCGAEKVQAHHHNGYAPEHELDVTWLCPKHHKARHIRTSKKPTWERIGMRAYMDMTRPRRFHQYQTVLFSTQTTPKRLLQVLERLWDMLLTDEERAAVVAVIEKLAASEPKGERE